MTIFASARSVVMLDDRAAARGASTRRLVESITRGQPLRAALHDVLAATLLV
jgi:hypothetical protein